MSGRVVTVLQEGRRREKEQTAFYRETASRAEAAGDSGAVERIQALLADEQHHLARLSARLLELGGTPSILSEVMPADFPLESWEREARSREKGEIDWYVARLKEDMDPATRRLMKEILDSERAHERELAGKWMSA